jgi:cell division septation protein DedD
MAQDDYYYEIQLTNKQLVFYFMAGATGLILSFLAGVMVGRGVDTAQSEVQARNVGEERVIAEEPGVKATASPDLTYAHRLESERVDTSLEKGKAASPPPTRTASGSAPPATVPAPKRATPEKAPSGRASETAPSTKPTPAVKVPAKTVPAKSEAAPRATEPSFTIQVGAFKDKSTAESMAARLKGKGFAAYVVSPEGGDPGLFVVRVGHYAARGDAERAEARLRDQEKFKPYIVPQ